MKGTYFFPVFVLLINFGFSSNLIAFTEVKMKTGETLHDIDSLKIYNSHIAFYKVSSGKIISVSKKQIESISFENGNMLRYKTYSLSSYPGSVNLNVVNFFNGSFISGTVDSITTDSIYLTILNDTVQSVIPSLDVSFINYGNSLVEEFVYTKSLNSNQETPAESVFKKRYIGESGNESFLCIKAGYVSSWMNSGYETSISNKPGFMFGGSYYNRYASSAAIDLSLIYVQKGAILNGREYPTGLNREYQINFNYIEFQGNYQLIIPFKKWNWYFDFGLFMAEMINASGIDKSATPDSSFKIKLSGGQSDLNRFDLGLGLGTGGNFKINDHQVSIGFRMSDGWIITGNTFNYNYSDLNYFRTQNYISVYATYGFRVKEKALSK